MRRTKIDRAVRVAERIWKLRQREAQAVRTSVAVTAAVLARETARNPVVAAPMGGAQTADAGPERLYSPVNQETRERLPSFGAQPDRTPASAPREAVPAAVAA
jgi:hypothetical protein